MKPSHLVDDWKEVHKWWSARLMAILAIAPVVYENIGFLQDFIPTASFHWLMGGLGAAALASRLIKQS
jgi:hypothetical protein